MFPIQQRHTRDEVSGGIPVTGMALKIEEISKLIDCCSPQSCCPVIACTASDYHNSRKSVFSA